MEVHEKFEAIVAYATAVGLEAEITTYDDRLAVEVMVKSRRDGSVRPNYINSMSGLLSAVGGTHEDGTEL